MDYAAKLKDMQKYIPFLNDFISLHPNNGNGNAAKKLLKLLNGCDSGARKTSFTLYKIEKLIFKIKVSAQFNMVKYENLFEEKPVEIVEILSSDSESDSDEEIKFRSVPVGEVGKKNNSEEDSLFVRRSNLERKKSNNTEIIEITDSEEEDFKHNNNDIKFMNKNDKMEEVEQKSKSSELPVVPELSPRGSIRDPRLRSRYDRRSIYSKLEDQNTTEELNVEHQDPTTSRVAINTGKNNLQLNTIKDPTTSQDAINTGKDNLPLNTTKAAKIQNRRQTLCGISKEALKLMEYTKECFDGKDIIQISKTGRKRRISTYQPSNEHKTDVIDSNSPWNYKKFLLNDDPKVKKFKNKDTSAKMVRRQSCSAVNWSIINIPEPRKIESPNFESSDSDSDYKMKIKPLILSRRSNIIVSDEDEEEEEENQQDNSQSHREKEKLVKECQVRIRRLKVAKLSDRNQDLFGESKKSYELLYSKPPSLPIFKKIAVLEKTSPKRVKRKFYQNINKNICFSNILREKCFICHKKINRNLVKHYVYKHPESEVLISRIKDSLIKEIGEKPIIGTAEDTFNKKFKVKCIFCNEIVLESINKLHEHYASHTGEFAYECDGCNMKSPYEKELNDHVKLNKCKSAKKIQLYAYYAKDINQIFAYLCNECNFIQLNKANIERHLTHEHDITSIDSSLIKQLVICKLENYKELDQVPIGPVVDISLVKFEENYDICIETNKVYEEAIHSPPETTTIHSPPEATTIHSPPEETIIHSPPEATTIHSPLEATTTASNQTEDLIELRNLLESRVPNDERDNESDTTLVFDLKDTCEITPDKIESVNSLHKARKIKHLEKKEKHRHRRDEKKPKKKRHAVGTRHIIPKLITSEQRYKCSAKKCKVIATTEDSLAEHFLHIHRKLKKYECNFCDFAIHHEIHEFKLIKDHLRMHSENIYVCGKCNHASHCRTDLTKHMREKHKMEMSFTHIKRQINDKNKLISLFTTNFENNENKLNIDYCPICSISLNSKHEVLNHIKIEHDCLISYQCTYCKHDCSHVQGIEHHNVQKHPGKLMSISCVFKYIENHRSDENHSITKLSENEQPVTSQPTNKRKHNNTQISPEIKKLKVSHPATKVYPGKKTTNDFQKPVKLPHQVRKVYPGKKSIKDFQKTSKLSIKLNHNFVVDDQPVILECTSTNLNDVDSLKENEVTTTLSPEKSCTNQTPHNKQTTDALLVPNLQKEPKHLNENSGSILESELLNVTSVISPNKTQHNLVSTTTESLEFQNVTETLTPDSTTAQVIQKIRDELRNNNNGSPLNNGKNVVNFKATSAPINSNCGNCAANEHYIPPLLQSSESQLPKITVNPVADKTLRVTQFIPSLQSPESQLPEITIVPIVNETLPLSTQFIQPLQSPESQLAQTVINSVAKETLPKKFGIKLVPIQKLLQPQLIPKIANSADEIKIIAPNASNDMTTQQIYKPNNNNLELHSPIERINRTEFRYDQAPRSPTFNTRNMSNNITLTNNQSFQAGTGGNVNQYPTSESYCSNRAGQYFIASNTFSNNYQAINDFARPTVIQTVNNQISNQATPVNFNEPISFVCYHCDHYESSMEVLVSHWGNEHSQSKAFQFRVKKFFRCLHCEFLGSIDQLWSHHKYTHHISVFAVSNQLRNRCGLCNFTFSSTFELEKHFKSAHPLECNYCNFVSCDVTILNEHYIKFHLLSSADLSKNLLRNSSRISEPLFNYLKEIGFDSLIFECNYCRIGYVTENECKSHVELTHCVQANVTNLFTVKTLTDVLIGCIQCLRFYNYCDSNVEKAFKHFYESHSPRDLESYFQGIHYIFPKGLTMNLHDMRDLKNFFSRSQYLSIIKEIESKK